jgi:cytochrome c
MHTVPSRRWSLLLVPMVLAAAGFATPASREGESACRGPEVRLPRVCGADLRNPEISCALPADVQGELRQPSFNVRQRASDLFSWQVFLALDWPALPGRRGEPDPAAPITAPGPRVWETWKETGEVFRHKDGQPIPPEPWNAPAPLPAACRGTEKLLFRDEKVDDELDAVIQPTFADGTLPGTLTDQAGRRVRYEIRLNRTAFDYIVDRRLWDGNAQAQAALVFFPSGSQIVKAAWREVDAAMTGRFHTVDACLCEEGAGGEPTDCRVQRMGLVGFHIMSKTPSAPQWIWSTFEQVDNVAGTHGAPASFHDPACPGCVPNRQSEPGFPNQVTRVVPIPSRDPDCGRPDQAVDNVAQLNRDMAAALARKGSVFRFYELISTQWPVPSSGPATVFDVFPRLLGNTTLETYIQETSSCMGCHAVAGTDRQTAWLSADFTFTLNNAWPNPNLTPTDPRPNRVPRGARIIPPPARPATAWDLAHWNDVIAGYELATRTYEILPAHTGARLHCSSCHLGAGRDPQAAWWVGMLAKYKTPENLYNRINGCFERSENGSAICGASSGDGAVPCSDSPAMRGLVTYMEWLDEQWQEWKQRTGYDGPTPNGFPSLPSGLGHAGRGELVFQQKCAFCHGAEGQGRYESGTYYRPALWGPESFNADAGLGQAAMLTTFLYANMPYGNGGALTVQEARDVACFIESQERPGRKSGESGDPACATRDEQRP